MYKAPKILSDLGTILLGFSIYDLIYAEWSSRLFDYGLSGDDFGLVKAFVVLVYCIIVVFLAFAESTAAFTWSQNEFRQEVLNDISKDGLSIFSVILSIVTCAALWFAFSGTTAFMFFVGYLLYTGCSYVTQWTESTPLP